MAPCTNSSGCHTMHTHSDTCTCTRRSLYLVYSVPWRYRRTFFLVKSVRIGRSLECELLNLANVSLHTLFIRDLPFLIASPADQLICFVTSWRNANRTKLDDVMLYSIWSASSRATNLVETSMHHASQVQEGNVRRKRQGELLVLQVQEYS